MQLLELSFVLAVVKLAMKGNVPFFFHLELFLAVYLKLLITHVRCLLVF